MNVKQAAKQLGFKSLPSIARIIYKKSSHRRGDRINWKTKLDQQEIRHLKEFKQGWN